MIKRGCFCARRQGGVGLKTRCQERLQGWLFYLTGGMPTTTVTTHAVTTCWLLLIGPLFHWSVLPLATLNKHKYSYQVLKCMHFHKIRLSNVGLSARKRPLQTFKHDRRNMNFVSPKYNVWTPIKWNAMMSPQRYQNRLYMLQSEKCLLFASWSYQSNNDYVRVFFIRFS